MKNFQKSLSYLESFEGKGLEFVCKQLNTNADRSFKIERNLFKIFGYEEFLRLSCNDHLKKNGLSDCDCVQKIKIYISMWAGHGGIEFIGKKTCGIIETNENRAIGVFVKPSASDGGKATKIR